jgi:protein-disulfide isomerase
MGKEIKILGLLLVIVIIGVFLGSNYYKSSVTEKAKTDDRVNPFLIRDDSPTLGPANAKVTIVEFLDPECEACAAFGPTIKKLVKEYEPNVRLVIRYMPFHPSSMMAANFLEAAGEQGKYWEALDLIFAKQSEWGEIHGAPPGTKQPDARAAFERFTKELGLDLEKVDSAIKENRFGSKVDRDKQDGQTVGVRQTPTIFVNGRKMNRLFESELRSMIKQELEKN